MKPLHWTLAALYLLIAPAALAAGATLQVTVIDGSARSVTPAMMCITDSEGRVRLPPDGRIMDEPSGLDELFNGVDLGDNPNQAGPPRRIQYDGWLYGKSASVPYWKEPVMYLTSGEFRIELPPGTYRVAADHGLEYVPAAETVSLTEGQTQDLVLTLNRWVDMPALGWWSGDIHIHHPTRTPAERDFLLRYARAADVHVANILEMGHHEGTDFKQGGFGETGRHNDGHHWIVSGQEDPRSTFGHIIGLNINAMARDLSIYDYYDLTFNAIHEQPGALVGFAHFAWNGCDLPRGFPWYVTTEALDFIEILQFRHLNRLDYYEYLNLGFRLTAAAGSDVPWGSTVGEVRTYVYTGGPLNVDEWFAGLKKGHTFVTNGPILEFTVDGQLPGTELHLSPGATVHVSARVLGDPVVALPTALTLVGSDGVLEEMATPAGEASFGFDKEIVVRESQWLVLTAVGDNGSVAHTTPVYLIVDGRPHWNRVSGPRIIQNQLAAIDTIDAETDPEAGPRERGIQERLDAARAYYANLLTAMQEAVVLDNQEEEQQ